MTPKLTLTIAAGIGLVFSSVMFFMPGLLFLLHGSPADGQIPQKLVTLRYVFCFTLIMEDGSRKINIMFYLKCRCPLILGSTVRTLAFTNNT